MEDYQTSIGVILKMGASAEAAAEVPLPWRQAYD